MGEWRVRAAASRSRAARAFCVAIVLASAARAHLPAPPAPPPASHDDILRVQLWDAEGLSEHPAAPTGAGRAERPSRRRTSLGELHRDMFAADDGSEPGRFVRHRVRHKRRRARDERGGAPLDAADADPELPWSFHGGGSALNVVTYESGEEPPGFDEGKQRGDNATGLTEITGAPASRGVDISPGRADGVGSAVSSVWSASLSGVNGEAGPPMTLRQDIDDIENAEESEKKTVAVVPKCCPSGQNLTAHLVDGKRVCQPSLLTFQPLFYEYNETFMWEYESNLFETIVGNPCVSDRYKLNPEHDSRDEFYLTVNGTMFAPFHAQPFLSPREYCMETFYSESRPAGVTLPLVCFLAPAVTASQPSATLVAYALGLILSVPFLVATACAYTLIPELRDTHGLALACHSACLAVAFSCLAATQLAGHAFPERVCTAMAFVIQFSFVSCFFWLNVMCFDIWLNVRHHLTARSSRRSERRRFVWYAAYAALLPLALLVVTLVMDLHPAVPSTYLKPNFGVKGCWFKTEEAALPYFYGPVACILLANLLIFFLTSRAFAMQYDRLNNLTVTELTHPEFSTSEDWVRLSETLDRSLQAQAQAQAQMEAHSQPERDAVAAGTPPPPAAAPAAAPHERHASFKSRWKKYRKIFRTCLLLSCIMGISWVMEVVSWAVGAGASEALTVWSIFDVVNALQGLVIFAIFILQAPVRGLVWRRMSAKCSRLCSGSKNTDSEMEVVSERTIIDFESSRKRVYV